jgi:tetratricopeptide (TPR) repeat protein
MRARASGPVRSPLRRARVLAAALGLCACAAPQGAPPAPSGPHAESGFTIAEKGRVSGAVRADFERALLLLGQERRADGIALLVEVTRAAPELVVPHIDLGIAYARTDDLPRAESSLLRALELDPRHPVAHNELGIVYRRMGRFSEARQSYEKALALHPDFHFARRNLAILCDLYLADPGCALEHYEAYARTAPGDEAAAMWIADLRARSGR